MKKFLRYTGIVALVAIILYCGYQIFDWYKQNHDEKQKEEAIQNAVKDTVPDDQQDDGFVFTHEAWEKLHAQNPDFVGYIHFDNDSISLPLVQTDNDSDYLRRDFNGNYSVYGTAFIDGSSQLDDDNRMIYGHSVDYGKQIMFTPLVNYESQDYYDSCHTFSIWYESTRHDYEIVSAYYLNTSNRPDYDYRQQVFADENEFNTWKSVPESSNMITPATSFEYGKHYVTLQTCKPLTNAAVKLFVVAKEVASSPY